MPRFSCSYVNQRWPRCSSTSTCERSQTPLCLEGVTLDTIKSSDDISEIFRTGKRFSNKYATFIVKQNHGRNGRVAFIAGKKNGNAVWRNRAKRRLREIFHHSGMNWADLDILFIAKKPLTEESYSKVLSECIKTSERFSRID